MTTLATQPTRRGEGLQATTSIAQVDATVALHAVPQVWLEPTQTWLYNQITHLPPHVCSHVLCERIENLDLFPFPRIHSFERELGATRLWDRTARSMRMRRHLGFFERTVRKVRPSILHSHFGPTAWALLDVAQRAQCPHVVSFYGLDVNFLPQNGWCDAYQELFAEIDLVLCEGPHMARCIASLGCSDAKIRVHHLGVPVRAIEFRPRRWSAQSGEPLRVLMAASFREKKGIPVGIEALGLLSRDVEVRATIIGGASDSDQSRAEERRIHETIERTGMRGRVRLPGFQPPDVLMREALEHHIFLAPSLTAAHGDTEGGAPITLIEMAASGMPIVSTTHCDIPEVIEDGVSGLLAPERDAEALAAQLRRLIANPDAWGAMLEAGRVHMEAAFDAQAQGAQLANHYRDVLAARNRSIQRVRP